jgi:acetyltransferase-like isoleucine patch superfamily enzyme
MKMRVLEKVVYALIRRLKNNNNYVFQHNYSLRNLFMILYYRGWQMLRGLLKRPRFRSICGIVFVGRNVVLEHGNLIRAGKSLIIEDNVFVNALSKQGINLGNNVTIGKYSILICTGVIANVGEGIEIGNNSAVGAQSFLGGQGGIIIGNDVIMGPGVKIFSENHNFNRDDIVIRLQGETRKGVKIGNNCWIGASVTIVDGVYIGDGVVIAASSVVTKDVPADSVVAAVPARVLTKEP